MSNIQKLIFEPSWERAVAPRDREYIETIFHDTNPLANGLITFTPLRIASNYKHDLLVTTLIQNTYQETICFHQQPLTYIENHMVMAKHTFTLNTVQIPAMSSMPWTFIFPASTVQAGAKYQNGSLHLVK